MNKKKIGAKPKPNRVVYFQDDKEIETINDYLIQNGYGSPGRTGFSSWARRILLDEIKRETGK